MAHYKIGELAMLTRCPVETICFYERKGLVPAPVRSENNYRVYGEAHAARLQFIRHCRSLDMTLDEIRTLLRFKDSPELDCREVNLLLEKHSGHVADRIAELSVLQNQLYGLRALCTVTNAARDCGILHSLTAAEKSVAENSGSHEGAIR